MLPLVMLSCFRHGQSNMHWVETYDSDSAIHTSTTGDYLRVRRNLTGGKIYGKTRLSGLLAGWLKSDSFWGGRDRADRARRMAGQSRDGKSRLRARLTSRIDNDDGFVCQIFILDTWDQRERPVEAALLAWEDASPNDWRVLDEAPVSGSMSSRYGKMVLANHAWYFIDANSVCLIEPDKFRLGEKIALPRNGSDGAWFARGQSIAFIECDRGEGRDPLYADLFNNKYRIVRDLSSYRPPEEQRYPLRPWQRQNLAQLARSRYQPGVRWTSAVEVGTAIQSAGPFLVVGELRTRLVSPETGKTIVTLPYRMQLVKSDGKTALCLVPTDPERPYPESNSKSLDAYDVATGKLLWSRKPFWPNLFTPPSDGAFFAADQSGIYRFDARTGKVLQTRALGPQEVYARAMVSSAQFVYVDWDAASIYALKADDLQSGIKEFCISHPVSVADGRVLTMPNINGPMATLELNGSSYTPFRADLWSEKEVNPAVIGSRVISTGEFVEGESISPEYTLCFDIPSHRLLWKRQPEAGWFGAFGPHVASTSYNYAIRDSYELDVIDPVSGALQWRKVAMNSGGFGQQVAVVGDTLFYLNGDRLTALK